MQIRTILQYSGIAMIVIGPSSQRGRLIKTYYTVYKMFHFWLAINFDTHEPIFNNFWQKC